MPAVLPETSEFTAPVYGTVFARRSSVVQRLRPGAPLILVPDPPGIDDPSVWVHAAGGDVVGHLSPDLSAWLVPWMLAGHRCRATVARVGGAEVASWKRLIIEVRCERRAASNVGSSAAWSPVRRAGD
jgi:hypothetical protein